MRRPLAIKYTRASLVEVAVSRDARGRVLEVLIGRLSRNELTQQADLLGVDAAQAP